MACPENDSLSLRERVGVRGDAQTRPNRPSPPAPLPPPEWERGDEPAAIFILVGAAPPHETRP